MSDAVEYIRNISSSFPAGTTIPIAISSTSLIISILVYFNSRHKNLVEQTYEFLNEWRDPELFESSLFLRSKLFYDTRTKENVELGLKGLSKEEFVHFRRVSHFLDYLGHAIQSRVVNKKLLFSTIAGSVENLWQIMGPIILAERKLRQWEYAQSNRGWYYQSGFEHAAERSRLFILKGKYLDALRYKGKVKTYPSTA